MKSGWGRRCISSWRGRRHRGAVSGAVWQSIRSETKPLAGIQTGQESAIQSQLSFRHTLLLTRGYATRYLCDWNATLYSSSLSADSCHRYGLCRNVFPSSSYDFDSLLTAVNKLTLNDASVSVQKESSEALGLGLRVGFLGLLHMDVFCTRLEQEFNASVIATQPSVPYIAVMDDGTELHIDTPSKFPTDSTAVAYYLEPYVRATLISPAAYQGDLMSLCQSRRGVLVDVVQLGSESGSRVSVVYRLPLQEVVHDFYSQVKSLTAGYASFEYDARAHRWQSPMLLLDDTLL